MDRTGSNRKESTYPCALIKDYTNILIFLSFVFRSRSILISKSAQYAHTLSFPRSNPVRSGPIHVSGKQL